jgi:hypothetical protein
MDAGLNSLGKLLVFVTCPKHVPPHARSGFTCVTQSHSLAFIFFLLCIVFFLNLLVFVGKFSFIVLKKNRVQNVYLSLSLTVYQYFMYYSCLLSHCASWNIFKYT